jgi:hypothetical protein
MVYVLTIYLVLGIPAMRGSLRVLNEALDLIERLRRRRS